MIQTQLFNFRGEWLWWWVDPCESIVCRDDNGDLTYNESYHRYPDIL